MKKLLLLLITLLLINSFPAASQGGLLKKVTGAMKNELTGANKSDNTKNQAPEPSCACNAPDLIFELGGNLQLNYSEITICSRDDGSLLLKDRITGSYYIVNGGVAQGPLQAGDSRFAGFDCGENVTRDGDAWLLLYGDYISKSGEKYIIKFGGKTYGPFALIHSFTVTKSKNKFAAVATENVIASEMDEKKMEEAIKNAKTDQERMQLAMQYSQQIQQKMMQGGGPESISQKLVTNIPDATFNPVTGGTINGKMKYDDILVLAFDKIMDLKGNTLITLKQEHLGSSQIFISTDNSRYAYERYGTLNFSNSNTSLTDFFNSRLVMANGNVYLAYMYYSPKSNAIMQCKIPF